MAQWYCKCKKKKNHFEKKTYSDILPNQKDEIDVKGNTKANNN